MGDIQNGMRQLVLIIFNSICIVIEPDIRNNDQLTITP